jgi:hypothetical protein
MTDYSEFAPLVERHNICASMLKELQRLDLLAPTGLIERRCQEYLLNRLRFLTFEPEADQARLATLFFANYQHLRKKYLQATLPIYVRPPLRNRSEYLRQACESEKEELRTQTSSSALKGHFYTRNLTFLTETSEAEARDSAEAAAQRREAQFYQRSISQYHGFHGFVKARMESYSRLKSRHSDMRILTNNSFYSQQQRGSGYGQHAVKLIKASRLRRAQLNSFKRETVKFMSAEEGASHAGEGTAFPDGQEELLEISELKARLKGLKLQVREESVERALRQERSVPAVEFKEVRTLIQLEVKDKEKERKERRPRRGA